MADGDLETRIHATAIGLGDSCVLIRGPSGAGKSDLALRCLAQTRPHDLTARAYLVADDQVIVRRGGERLLAEPPAAQAGLMEVRGIGIIRLPFQAPSRVTLAIDLVACGDVDRYPDPWPSTEILGILVPLMRLCAFEASAPAKLLLALGQHPWNSRVQGFQT